MTQGISQPLFERLRKATLSNNLIWLQSFGCKIDAGDELIQVHHPGLPDYSAWLIIGPPERTNRHLQSFLDKFKGVGSIPDIYIDGVSYSLSNQQILAENHFDNVFISITMINPVPPRSRPLALTLERVDLHSFNQWLLLYAEGFNRRGPDEETDRSRWLLSFEKDDAVQHWFFMKDSRIIGICQTCQAEGVVGAYSFTLRPGFRGIHWVRAANYALNAKAAEMGEQYFYLERLLPTNSNRIRRRLNSSSRIIMIRKMLGYRRSMSL